MWFIDSIGSNGNGQLGLGDNTDRAVPVMVMGSVIQVAASWFSSLFIAGNQVFATGYNFVTIVI